MTSVTKLRRMIIKGTLTTRSAFHIGSGDIEHTDHHKESIAVNVVAKDWQQQPYIPGSTLRGFLRHQVSDCAIHKFLFGYARQASDSKTQGVIGALRISDARFQGEYRSVCVMRTRFDSVTATAKAQHLFTDEFVPVGSKFSVEMQLDSVGSSIDADAISTLMGALDRLNHLPIGGGTSVGQGHVCWTPDEAITIGENDIRKWLKQDQNQKKTPRALWQSVIKKKTETFKKHAGIFSKNEDNLLPLAWTTLPYQLTNEGPLLINDPQAKDETTANDNNNDRSAQSPQLITMRSNHEYIIPGTTLKGWFRSQSRRVLLTITQGNNPKRVDELIDQLFGSGSSLGNASLIRFNTATSPVRGVHQQTFTAIDRFTGGVKDNALYQTSAVSSEHTFSASVHINEPQLTGWMKLLLLHVWSDALRRDMRLGWGKSRGYGLMQVNAQEVVGRWTRYTPDVYAQWLDELHDQLNQEPRDV